ncbi:MAG: hypothetical protein WKG07_09020 [Hymenobacter sp.]
MEEAIASSQFEGAATTREVAKDMLHKKRNPRNASERLIFNNYQTIQYTLEQKQQALTPEMLCQIQARMTQGTLENTAHAGRFRLNDEVRVKDFTTGEVVHIPPSHQYLPELLRWYCAWPMMRFRTSMARPARLFIPLCGLPFGTSSRWLHSPVCRW